jgi:diguanylate cyclase (GGDEF)-like protein
LRLYTLRFSKSQGVMSTAYSLKAYPLGLLRVARGAPWVVLFGHVLGRRRGRPSGVGRSRTVLVASLGLAVVAGVLSIVGSVGVHRMLDSRQTVSDASQRLTAYQHVQRALAGEALAQAALERDPSALPAAQAAARALDTAVAEIRRTASASDRDTAGRLAALNAVYARELPSRVAVDALTSMQAVLDPAVDRSAEQLDAAMQHQRVVVTRMAWRGPLVLTVSFALLGTCWLLLVRYGRHAAARADASHQLALEDPLTGLANRRAFESALAPELSSLDADSAVLLIDLDDFKDINDTWGHDIGDQVLKKVAGRLTETVRETDVVARLGGDEFAVLVRPAASAEALRQRLQLAVSEPMVVRGVKLQPHSSIGVAQVSPGQLQEDVLRAADVSLYARKRERVELSLLRQRRSPESG